MKTVKVVTFGLVVAFAATAYAVTSSWGNFAPSSQLLCLGLKSPFIEFSNEIEVLANTSISLNITKDEQALMHQEGLKKLGTFIKPVDLRDAATGFVKVNLTKKLPPTSHGRRRGNVNPIQEEMEQKPIVLLDEDTDENGLPASLTDEDRKFIVPMALKNVTPDPKAPTTLSTTTTSTTTTTTTTAAPDFASNIDDLKNHILFLQNMTKHNSNFQSKFVVFPSLQKEKSLPTTTTTSTTSTTTTQRSVFRYTPPLPPPTRRATFLSYTTSSTPRSHQFDHYFDHDDPMAAVQREKITIVPQVLLLNDQTPPDDNEEDSRRLGDHKDQRVIYSRRRNFRKSSTAPSFSTTMSSTTTAIAEKPFRKNPKRPRNNGEKRNKNQRKPCKNPDSPKCQRQRRRQEMQMLEQQQSQQYQPMFQPFLQTINNTRRFAVSIEIPDSFKIKPNQTKDSSAELKLSRPARSHHKRRNIGASKIISTYGSTYYDAPAKEFIMSGGQFGLNGQMFLNNTPNPTAAAYSEPIDLNPDLCYDVDGLTYGQKKLCVMHTNVMPAISRGARSAIQECQYQFKNRRWNCSTTEDNTVFGPMSSLGSPEMAFIHALASATVTSFIARACRDGQLASCGCSRSARPRQLHDDWAWGGCGDDLEYAYKFSQDFIDIREKERKRGTRGLASGPRIKNDEKSPAKSPAFPTQREVNITATDAVDASSGVGISGVGVAGAGAGAGAGAEVRAIAVSASVLASPAEKQNGTSSTTLRTLQDGHANITVNVDSDNKNSSRSFSASLPISSTSVNKENTGREEEDNPETGSRFKPEVLLELQERITKEILNSKLQEKEMLELQEKINREILNSKVFNLDHYSSMYGKKKKNQRAVNSMGTGSSSMMGIVTNGGGSGSGRFKNAISAKARSLMNLHNNEAGRRAVIKKARITCKCHGVSGSCSLITCWQQLSSIREIGDYLRERYDEATEVKLNKRGRLQVKDPQFKVPTVHDLVYLDESPDWCRNNRQLQWPGTHGRICNKTSSGLDGCGILCCGRGYNTKNIVVRERCNCKFHWCCQVKCDICVKVLEEHTCK